MIDMIFIGVVAFIIGWYGREQYAKHVVAKYIQRVETESTYVKHTHVRFEQQNCQLFAYDSETDEFLAQGANYKEVETLLLSQYPDVYFTVSKDNIKETTINDTV